MGTVIRLLAVLVLMVCVLIENVAVSAMLAILYFLPVGFVVRIESMKYDIGTEEVEPKNIKKLALAC